MPEDSVGILFGDSGILTKRAVDNLHVGFHEDHGVGTPWVCDWILCGDRQNPAVPSNPNRVKDETDHPFNNPANWKEVSHLTVEEPVAAGKMNHFAFDKVDTYAVRIRMKTPEGKRGSSYFRNANFAKKVAAESKSQLTIRVNNQVLPGINPSVTDYYIDGRVVHKWMQALVNTASQQWFQASTKVSQSASSTKQKMAPSLQEYRSISQAMQKNWNNLLQ